MRNGIEWNEEWACERFAVNTPITLFTLLCTFFQATGLLCSFALWLSKGFNEQKSRNAPNNQRTRIVQRNENIVNAMASILIIQCIVLSFAFLLFSFGCRINWNWYKHITSHNSILKWLKYLMKLKKTTSINFCLIDGYVFQWLNAWLRRKQFSFFHSFILIRLWNYFGNCDVGKLWLAT